VKGPARTPIEMRFWSKVTKGAGCWEWTASTDHKGYGKLAEGGRQGRTLSAHRVSYELNVGPIPDGLLVLHRCDNPPCVRPDHLFVGTHTDNAQDMAKKGRSWRQRQSECVNGHPFTDENTYRSGNQRRCKTCVSISGKRRYQRKRAA